MISPILQNYYRQNSTTGLEDLLICNSYFSHLKPSEKAVTPFSSIPMAENFTAFSSLLAVNSNDPSLFYI